jgi:hypothetical protein
MRAILKDQSFAILIALIAAAVMVNGATWFFRVERAIAPASDWFEVHTLHIPDHEIGTNPVVDFTRTIKQRLAGQWSVETQKLIGARWRTVCRDGDLSFYSPDEDLPNPVRLNWFRGRCNEVVGEQRLQVVWMFVDQTGQTRAVLRESNTYKVK